MGYTETIRSETKYFATWPPDGEIQLGDFGVLEGALFRRQGRLDPAELASVGQRRSAGTFSFDVLYHATRQLKVGVEAAAKVDVANGRAMLEIGFGSTDAVVFAAPDTHSVEMEDLLTLGRTLVARRKDDAWDMNYLVVSRVVTAPRATIVLSNANTARLEFDVDGKAHVDPNLVANLNAGASFINAEGVGIQVVGKGPLTPLFGLVQLKIPFIGDPKIIHREASEDDNAIRVDDEHLLVDYGPPQEETAA